MKLFAALFSALLFSASVAVHAELDPAIQREVSQAEDQFVGLQLDQLIHKLAFAKAMLRYDQRQERIAVVALSQHSLDLLVQDGLLIPEPGELNFRIGRFEPTPDFLRFRTAVFAMEHQFKDTVQELVRKRKDETFTQLPKDIQQAYLEFKEFNEQFVPKFDPLNARMIQAQNDGYASRWGLW